MSDPIWTGVQVLDQVDSKLIDLLFKKGFLQVSEIPLVQTPYPNSFVVLKANGKQSALTRVTRDGKAVKVIKDQRVSDLQPKNKEQSMLLSVLLDTEIPVTIVTGPAGTGKTLATMAAAMQQVDNGNYDKIILTKPMSQVGGHPLGILPGTVEEKFMPFLMNYASNLEVLLGSPDLRKTEERRKGKKTPSTVETYQSNLNAMLMDFMTQYRVEIVPLQLMRGASFNNSFIIADEVQTLDHHEILTLGTRVASTSKLVLMGDLNQRDESIARRSTGLWKAANDERMKKSELVSFIELRKVERGPVSELFADVFTVED